jgi:hypothetical protein
LLASVGIRVSSFFAGVAGGFVGVCFDDKASLRIWIAYTIGGGLVANYLGSDASRLFPSFTELGLGFGLGVAAPVVVGAIKAMAAKWRPPQPGGGA